jgi:hypothetical protein
MSTLGDVDLVQHLSIPSSVNLQTVRFEAMLDQVDILYMSSRIISPLKGHCNDDNSKTTSSPGSPTDSVFLFGWTAYNISCGETAKNTAPNGRVSTTSTDSPPGETSSRYRSSFLQHDGQDPKIAKTDREEWIQERNAATPSFSMERMGR